MVLNKPRTVWQWLLLLTPALEMMSVEAMPVRWAAYLLPRDEIPDLTLDILNLSVVLALSMVLGCWLCWHRVDRLEGIVTGMGFGVLVALGNAAIGFAGCTVGHALLDKQ